MRKKRQPRQPEAHDNNKMMRKNMMRWIILTRKTKKCRKKQKTDRFQLDPNTVLPEKHMSMIKQVKINLKSNHASNATIMIAGKKEDYNKEQQ